MGDDNFYTMMEFFKNLTTMMNIDRNNGMQVRKKNITNELDVMLINQILDHVDIHS